LSNCKNEKNETIDTYSSLVIKNFFQRVAGRDYMIALDSLLLSNKNIDFTDSATAKLKEGFKDINELSGKYLNYELLKKRIIKDDIAIYSYLVKYEKKFYRFVFTFYKTEGKVNIYKFAYDDVLDLELEESIKLYTQ
jgi:hypothetical protein